MSNPGVFLLSEGTIHGNKIRIEDNLGEGVHIHIGDFRFSLTIDEFKKISKSIQEAADEILKTNKLSLDMFDLTALDWDWIGNYSRIVSMEKVSIKISQLYTKTLIGDCNQLMKIVPIRDSMQLKALEGDMSTLLMYQEQNLYGQTNQNRLEGVIDAIKKMGYPYDNKYIMVNQYYQIYDRDQRAASLYYLYVGDYEIPVIKITLEGEPSIEEQIQKEKIRYEEYIKQKNSIIEPEKKWSEDLNKLNISYNEFLGQLKNIDPNFYVLQHGLSGTLCECVADNVIITSQDRLQDICRKMGVSYFGANYFRKYKFLYSMQRAVYIELEDRKVIMFDRLFCKSMFENSFIPLDKKIQKFSFGEKRKNNSERYYISGIKTELLYVISKAIFIQGMFLDSDIQFIEKNNVELDDLELAELLEYIFFGYTHTLIKKIKERTYNDIVNDYISYYKY